jgi:hypothetical protein
MFKRKNGLDHSSKATRSLKVPEIRLNSATITVSMTLSLRMGSGLHMQRILSASECPKALSYRPSFYWVSNRRSSAFPLSVQGRKLRAIGLTMGLKISGGAHI